MALLAFLLLAAGAGPAFSQPEPFLSRPTSGETPTKVAVGFYLADIFEISAPDQTMLADVVIQAEWEDPRLAGRWSAVHSAALDEVWNPNLQLVNQRGVSMLLPQRVDVDPSGRVRWQQRWVGRISARMDLRDFPLDRQLFHIQVVSLGYTPDEVALVLRADYPQSGRAATLSVTDWSMGAVRVEAANFEPVPGSQPLSGAQLSWEGQRHIGYYAVLVIFPLILIVVMGSGALWIDPSIIAARVSIAMTTMLTLISYRFSIGKSVPTLTYLTRFDYFMLASTIIIFAIMALVAAGAHLVGKGRIELVKRIDGWACVAFPIVFAIVFVLAWWA
ncbi:hypothetical protein [Labrys monachus]|uniref:Neurotransmitter-gated ion-channel ligand-binding domain-containing protein n=1 Tax=Labrys monachus TaxID=217067 RepID=A0ABU0F6M5_9HYPH|nr:hypothetical protein [Labrys monachus]MDQ0390268.1 hypothetical protein [Labrys monachus]